MMIAAHAQAYASVAAVGKLGVGKGIEIKINYILKCTDGGCNYIG